MQTYHFKKKVGSDGSLRLSELPPNIDVEVVVLNIEPSDIRVDLQQWLADIRSRHPFANMSKEEILKQLRNTRDTVWAERHAG
jgi:hypothetical protein